MESLSCRTPMVEISFTIPMNQDRVFAVLEYLLKMHTKQNSNANLSKSADNSSPNIDGLSSYDGEDQNDNGLLASSKPSTSGVMVKSNTSSSGSHSSSSMLNSGGSTTTSGESSSGGYLGMMDKMTSQTDNSQNIGVENEQHAQWL